MNSKTAPSRFLSQKITFEIVLMSEWSPHIFPNCLSSIKWTSQHRDLTAKTRTSIGKQNNATACRTGFGFLYWPTHFAFPTLCFTCHEHFSFISLSKKGWCQQICRMFCCPVHERSQQQTSSGFLSVGPLQSIGVVGRQKYNVVQKQWHLWVCRKSNKSRIRITWHFTKASLAQG